MSELWRPVNPDVGILLVLSDLRRGGMPMSDRSAVGEDQPHPLPELLQKVLNGDAAKVRTGGWEVERLEGVVTIGRYDDPPEAGGHVRNVAVFEP